nr:unnamed protein product [Callosobruchus chinensis]
MVQSTRKKLDRLQKKSLLRVDSVYSIVSGKVSLMVTGTPPLHLLVKDGRSKAKRLQKTYHREVESGVEWRNGVYKSLKPSVAYADASPSYLMPRALSIEMSFVTLPRENMENCIHAVVVEQLFTLDLEHNNIRKIKTKQVSNVKAEQLLLNYNDLQVVEEAAFAGSEIANFCEASIQQLQNTQASLSCTIANIESRLASSMSNAETSATSATNNTSTQAEALEILRRSHHIILRGIPEDNNDTNTVTDIINHIDPSANSYRLSVARLGAATTSRPRLIRVGFASPVIAKAILRRKNSMLSHPVYKSIKISDDKTPSQMRELQNLRDELKRRLTTGERNITIKYVREENIHHTFSLPPGHNIHDSSDASQHQLLSRKTTSRSNRRQKGYASHHIIRLKHNGGVPMPLMVVILPKRKKSQQVFNEHELLGLSIRVEARKKSRLIEQCHRCQKDLSSTSITFLPTEGLREIDTLKLQNTKSLKVFPSVFNYQVIENSTFFIHITVNDLEDTCPNLVIFLRILLTLPISVAPMQQRFSNLKIVFLKEAWLTYPYHCCAFKFPWTHNRGEYEKHTRFIEQLHEACDSKNSTIGHIFKPHEDPSLDALFHFMPLNTSLAINDEDSEIWGDRNEVFHNTSSSSFPVTTALCGEIYRNYHEFLMCNLAAADLCIGLHLLLIAAVDACSIGAYFNYAIDWQEGNGCSVAGFLTIFGNVLSVYTLAVITTERWYTITWAIHLNKRLKLRTAVRVMGAGWACALTMASLPLLGVSGYSKTSICLPLENSDQADAVYLSTLLAFNAVAFGLICVCYGSRRTGSTTSVRSDLTVAKRMALLVFTDFACWAPIAFFGLTALLGYPLITVTHTKILLVFFYPLNSCANPCLYALLTQQYRRDFFILMGRYGLCKDRAERHKGAIGGKPLPYSAAAQYRRTGGSNHRGSTLTTMVSVECPIMRCSSRNSSSRYRPESIVALSDFSTIRQINNYHDCHKVNSENL